MINETAYALGANRSCIRDLFEYGCQRAAIVGRENVYDYSLGNPSIPSPPAVNETICRILADTEPLAVHGYTSAVGDLSARQAIADENDIPLVTRECTHQGTCSGTCPTCEQEVRYLEQQLAYKDQEIEFLKKIVSLGKEEKQR